MLYLVLVHVISVWSHTIFWPYYTKICFMQEDIAGSFEMRGTSRNTCYTSLIQRPRVYASILTVSIIVIIYIFGCCVYQCGYKSAWWSWPSYKDWNIEGETPRWQDIDATISPVTKVKEYVSFSDRKAENRYHDDVKLILFNMKPFDGKYPFSFDSKTCGRNCRLSYDADLYDRADAVIFHFSETTSVKQRSFPQQLYVWMNQESPSTTYHNRRLPLKGYDGVFNLTMTYRRDSDIYYPYNTTVEIRETIKQFKAEEDLRKLISEKDRLSAWVARNCIRTKGSAFRWSIIENLRKEGLDIEEFGYCGKKTLPGIWADLPKHISRYKFYISFENSFHCRDYITEKLWTNALVAGAVPVVWGPMRRDVEAVLPRGSYIFVEDFASPEDLVTFMKYLDKNDDVYMKYFYWRNRSQNENIPGRKNEGQPWMSIRTVGFCQLCHMLHDDEEHERKHGTRPRRVVESLFSWWYLEETRTCLQPRPLWETAQSFVLYLSLLIKKLSMLSVFPYFLFIFAILVIILCFKLIRKLKSHFTRCIIC